MVPPLEDPLARGEFFWVLRFNLGSGFVIFYLSGTRPARDARRSKDRAGGQECDLESDSENLILIYLSGHPGGYS